MTQADKDKALLVAFRADPAKFINSLIEATAKVIKLQAERIDELEARIARIEQLNTLGYSAPKTRAINSSEKTLIGFG